jgi:hypothetical protein
MQLIRRGVQVVMFRFTHTLPWARQSMLTVNQGYATQGAYCYVLGRFPLETYHPMLPQT